MYVDLWTRFAKVCLTLSAALDKALKEGLEGHASVIEAIKEANQELDMRKEYVFIVKRTLPANILKVERYNGRNKPNIRSTPEDR